MHVGERKNQGSRKNDMHACKILLNFGVTIDLKDPYGPEEIEIQAYNTGKRTEEELEERVNE